MSLFSFTIELPVPPIYLCSGTHTKERKFYFMKCQSAWEILTEAVSQIFYIMLLRVRESRAREEAQWLRMCIAIQENLRSVSSTYIRHLIMVCNSSSQVSVNTGLEGTTILVTFSHRQIHIILIL